MSCSVDAVAWGERNRVTLATGKTQEWVLARTTRDRPTMDSVVATARAVLVKWFDGVALDTQFADAGDAVDDISILSVSAVLPPPSSSDERREQMDPVPLLSSSGAAPLYVRLRFNYRGYATSLPWPVWTATASPFKVDKLCPFDADWMLVWAKDPDVLPVAPEEASALDKLSEHGTAGLGGLADLVKLAGWGLALYAAAQVFTVGRALLPAPRARSRRAA